MGAAAWFPLGPNEPYAPWYHSSTLYLNRVNASNIYNRNVNQVRTIYNTTNRDVYAEPLGPQRQFENRALERPYGVPGQLCERTSVRSSLVHMQPGQLASAPMVAHPMVTPERTMVAPARAMRFLRTGSADVDFACRKGRFSNEHNCHR